MDATRFDNLTRALQLLAPRRAALGALGGGLATLLTRLGIEQIEAKKKKRKKLKKNQFGCVNVGGKCRGKDSVCCSGICQGKKPKKGKQDKSKCVAHNVLDCPTGADSCLEDVECGTSGLCFQTTGRASFCASEGFCGACQKDADCEPGFGPVAACIVCAECEESGTLCAFAAGA